METIHEIFSTFILSHPLIVSCQFLASYISLNVGMVCYVICQCALAGMTKVDMQYDCFFYANITALLKAMVCSMESIFWIDMQ